MSATETGETGTARCTHCRAPDDPAARSWCCWERMRDEARALDERMRHREVLGAALGGSYAWALDVFVPGKAEPKGSARAYQRGGKVMVVQDNAATQRPWAALVADVVGRAWRDRPCRPAGPTDLPVALAVDVVLPRRASAPKRSTPPHTRKPDGDKLLRLIMDALTHVVVGDDAQVIAWAGSKREAEPGETPGARVRIALPGDGGAA